MFKRRLIALLTASVLAVSGIAGLVVSTSASASQSAVADGGPNNSDYNWCGC
ncbi:hypothetical protein Cs7R123_79610 [Catellatospora sp. TT07R-123]|uniref:hypothetical protein n=1 Tax=Catellatospora sp. TT07R-123 TaxID=2733863 RepID=UPI001B2450A6|nr:hypothetical protein [Catellatospora sp. TT07R-123]GHJ50619.1 hypothetical protein Cs7R123_79610 [Catellatospora sp. TT07R-123]